MKVTPRRSRILRAIGRRGRTPRRPEVDPGAPRHRLESLDDWILFGPRLH